MNDDSQFSFPRIHDPYEASPVPAANVDQTSDASPRLDEDLDLGQGLAKLDPLTVRPRISSRVLCVVFALMLTMMAFGLWWVCVCTEYGQTFDELVWANAVRLTPGWATGVLNAVAQSWLVIAISCVLAVVGAVCALVRRRWWLVGQIVVFAALCYAATWLKALLPRPFIVLTESPVENSAPSGHTMLAAAAAAILVLTVPRAVRALAAVIGVVWSSLVGVSVIYGQWHRPSDVAMGVLLVTALGLLILTFTRRSGMDEPGRRISSISIQIVGSVLVTGGLLAVAYALYVIWQVVPGLNVGAGWAVGGCIISAMVALVGIAALAYGLLLVMRQLTASPLSRLGLIGAPPVPPRR